MSESPQEIRRGGADPGRHLRQRLLPKLRVAGSNPVVRSQERPRERGAFPRCGGRGGEVVTDSGVCGQPSKRRPVPSTRPTVLDAAMAQPEPVPKSPSDLDQERRTSMAVERTWLAWWRTALGASAGALAVGRFAPQLLDVAPWPYILLGCGYASLAVGLSIVGALRQRELELALRTDRHVPLRFRTVALFTIGGVALAVMTVVLVIAQT